MLTSDHEDDDLPFEYPGVAIPPPAAMVEAEIMQDTRIGTVGQIREQPEFAEKELRQRGTWAYDVLCRKSKTFSVPSETSPLAHMPLLQSGMAGHPLPADRHPMTKLADESDTAYASRMQERQNYFERNVRMKKQEQTETETLPFVPVAQALGLNSSGNVCPGPTGGGNLSFEETKMAVLQVLSDEECSALLAVLPRCQKHLDSLCWTAESGLKKPLGCGAGKKCNRPHAVSADDLYGDIDPEQLKYWKIQKKINTDKKRTFGHSLRYSYEEETLHRWVGVDLSLAAPCARGAPALLPKTWFRGSSGDSAFARESFGQSNFASARAPRNLPDRRRGSEAGRSKGMYVE